MSETIYDGPLTRADLELFGPGAGPRRNQAMLHLAEKVVAFPGGKGTANCVRQARALGLPVERPGRGER